MNATEWETSDDPVGMLDWLLPGASKRKLRLYVCACARLSWDGLEGRTVRRAVQAAEAYADDQMSQKQLRVSSDSISPGKRYPNCTFLSWVSCWTSGEVPQVCAEIAASDRTLPERTRAELLREVFDPSRRPVAAWPAHSVMLADEIYRTQNYRLAGVLADSLEDAGSDDEGLLGHLRSGRQHARGCWAIDLILGRN